MRSQPNVDVSCSPPRSKPGRRQNRHPRLLCNPTGLLTLSYLALKIDDPSLPAALKSVCKGGMNATTVLESKPFGSDGVVITKGYCTPPDSDSGSGTAVHPISVLTFCIDIRMPAVNLAASPASRPSCVTALNDCVGRFGGLFQGNGWVSKCGAPCFSV
jgi:hypothetical protein